MEVTTPTLERVGIVAAYVVLGVVGTAVVALVLLNTLYPIQQVVYEAFYLQVGPSEATETAILTHFLLAGFTAIGVALLAGDYVSHRLANRAAVGKALTLLMGSFVAFLFMAVLELAAFLTAIVVLAVTVLAVPLLLRYRFEVRSGGVPAFVGGIPVLILLILAAGFGLGWGWGYSMTAQEVPASEVDEPAPADFDDVPRIRDDLFAGDCSTSPDGRQVCRLHLRGYEHEVRAARFMARHGVRCPYQNAQTNPSNSFVATHDDSYYRVSCSPHGD